MQEAAALRRHDPAAKVLRLHIRVLDDGAQAGGSGSGGSGRRTRRSDDRAVAATLQVVQVALPAPAPGGGASSRAKLRRRLPSQEAIDIIAGACRVCGACVPCERQLRDVGLAAAACKHRRESVAPRCVSGAANQASWARRACRTPLT
jgi:hypothetical protein